MCKQSELHQAQHDFFFSLKNNKMHNMDVKKQCESVEETNCIPQQKGAQGSYMHVWFHVSFTSGGKNKPALIFLIHNLITSFNYLFKNNIFLRRIVLLIRRNLFFF